MRINPLQIFPAIVLLGLTAATLANAQPPSSSGPQTGAVPTIDLTHATLVSAARTEGPEARAVQMLIEESEKRSRITWSLHRTTPPGSEPVIIVGTTAELKGKLSFRSSDPALHAAEGYLLTTISTGSRTTVAVVGADSRGLLFGIGRLLRNLRFERDHISIPTGIDIATSPFHRLRGHQLGYRPKTNSYDGWSLPMWEQYVRDLIVFGANSVELIPPKSDDAADSPLFPEPPMQMMEKMSALLDSYGLDVWVWYPAMEKDYSDPQTLNAALAEWGETFRRLKRIDAVFVPGGDPGHTAPDILMAMLQKQSISLKRYHPNAKIWISPQGFTQEWVDRFLNIIRTQKPTWLGGVVFGPQVRTPLPELRKLLPPQYPIRHYPDITHTLKCQFPVENWDLAFARTEGREPINPRPIAEAKICLAHQQDTIGSISYSEGCNDDVNKALWSAMEWDPTSNVETVLREYSRYFIDSRFEETFAHGLLGLEQNWVGAAEANTSIPKNLLLFQQIEAQSSPQNRTNWRYQQALYRAYYDAYVHERARFERTAEKSALLALSRVNRDGWKMAVATAESALSAPSAPAYAEPLHVRLQVLAEALFQSIRMQLSVPLYSAIGVERGANLDQVDNRINDRDWLSKQLTEIRALTDDTQRLQRINQIVHWTDPGLGGFYDDLGDPRHRPHLIAAHTFDEDPGRMSSVRMGLDVDAPGRMIWRRFSETLYDTPLEMSYTGLDPAATYRVRITYGPDAKAVPISLTANGNIEVHPPIMRPVPNQPVEFDISQAATAGGSLKLTFRCPAGLGSNGRGCQVCEVWLIKK